MRVHISLHVGSIKRSARFYSTLFGHKASKSRAAYANFRLDQPPIHLALVEKESPQNTGISHLGIELPDAGALRDWRTRLEDSDIAFSVEGRARCCYATADKLWLEDPDGYRWEIWVRTGEFDGMGAVQVTQDINSENAIKCC